MPSFLYFIYFENCPEMSYRSQYAPAPGQEVLESFTPFFVLAISNNPSTAGIFLFSHLPVCTTAKSCLWRICRHCQSSFYPLDIKNIENSRFEKRVGTIVFNRAMQSVSKFPFSIFLMYKHCL